MSRICIIVLNYNGWADTIECLESLLRSTFTDFQIVVVDNASSDNSTACLKAWADGRLSHYIPPQKPQRKFSLPPTAKPISHTSLRQSDIDHNPLRGDCSESREKIVFISAEKNRGYAAGNNLGLRWGMNNGPFSHYWLLNNDTVVCPETLERLLAFTRRKPTAITGVTLLNYAEPHGLQSLGGHVNRFFGFCRPLLTTDLLKLRLDYIEGAALLLSHQCLETVGLLPEEYFLFFEEVDYCFRARRKKLTMDVAMEAQVLHKSRSLSLSCSETIRTEKNEFRDLLSLENRVRFARKHLKNRFGLKLGLFLSALIRIRRKQFNRTAKIIRLMFDC